MNNKFRWLSISAHNWGYFVRALIVQAIIIAIVVGICSVFIPPVITAVSDIMEQLDITGFVDEFLAVYNEGDFSSSDLALIIADKIDSIQDSIESMPALWERVEASLLIFFVLLCGYRMLVSIPDVPLANCLNEFMSTNSRRPIIWYFAKKCAVTVKFCLLQFLVAFPLDLIVVFSTLGFALMLTMFWGVGSVYIALGVGVVLFSLRYTMLAFWLPSIVVDDMGVRSALKNNFAVLSKCFWSVFIRNAIVVAIMLVGSLFINSYFLFDVTATIINTVVVLLLFYIIKCINLSAYYEACERPYFSKKISKKLLQCNNNTTNK